MRDRIREAAARNRRSMNSEIVHYLDSALDTQAQNGPAGTAIPPGLRSSNPHQEIENERAQS